MAKRTHDTDPLDQPEKRLCQSGAPDPGEEESSLDITVDVDAEPLPERYASTGPERDANAETTNRILRLVLKNVTKQWHPQYALDLLEESKWSTRFLSQMIKYCGDSVRENPHYVARWYLQLAYRREPSEANYEAWTQHILAHYTEESHHTAAWLKKVGAENYYVCSCRVLEPGERPPLRKDCKVCSKRDLNRASASVVEK